MLISPIKCFITKGCNGTLKYTGKMCKGQHILKCSNCKKEKRD